MNLPPFPFCIDQKYEAVRLLGKGGVGFAVLAKKKEEPVAVKLLNLTQVKNPQKVIQKFKKEFLTLKKLNHPHIGKIYDFGFDPDLNFYYFAGEYIQGREIRKATVQSPVEEIEALFVQTLQALHYLHTFGRAGLRHNDIKAANILVTQEANQIPAVKLIDFGLSGLAPLDLRGGTASYMSPEQIVLTFPEFAKGKIYAKPDERADLYALGVVWYFCLTGLNPFLVGGDPEASLKRHFEFFPQPPSSLRKESPAYLDKIILKLIKKNPDERYATAAEVIQDLRYLSGKPYSVIPQAARRYFLPEGEWIGQEQVWKPLKAKWEERLQDRPPPPECIWIIGRHGQGKTKILERFKNHVQTGGGRVLLLKQDIPQALEEWIAELNILSKNFTQKVAVAVDDFHAKHPVHPYLQELWKQIRYTRHWDSALPIPWLFVFTGKKEPFDVPEMPATTLNLRNFQPEEMRAYVRNLFPNKSAALPENFIQKLHQHTDGNPLFITQVLKALGEKGFLWSEDGAWHPSLLGDAAADFSKLPVPKDLGNALKQDWELLSPKEKEFLKWASCFPGGTPHDDRFPLERLIYLAILVLDDKGRLRFQNSFFQKQVYAYLSISEKEKYHEQIARELKKQKKPLHEIAYHFARTSRKEKRGKALKILARFYTDRGLLEEALDAREGQLKNLAQGTVSQKLEVILHMLHLLGGLRSFAKARRMADTWLKKNPKRPGYNIWRAKLLRAKGTIFSREHKMNEARKCFESALETLAATRGNLKERLILENNIANTWLDERKTDRAVEIYKKTREEAAKLKPSEAKEVTNNELGNAYRLNQEGEKAIRCLEEDLKFYEQIGDKAKLMRCYYHLGGTHRMLTRRFSEAVKCYQMCAGLARDMKNYDSQMRALNGLASTYLDRAHGKRDANTYNQALRYYQESLALCRHVNKDLSKLDIETAAIYSNIGMLQLETGNFVKAYDSFNTILTVLERKPQKGNSEWNRLCVTYTALADSLKAQKKYAEMEAMVKKAWSISSGSKLLLEHQVVSQILWGELALATRNLNELKEHFKIAEALVTKYHIRPTPVATERLDILKRIVAKLQKNNRPSGSLRGFHQKRS
ncbi:MAG: protein kinase [Deltaproteobacteria bacterium]|nr:protein kinase [Deltaproteobacteria bacterium]